MKIQFFLLLFISFYFILFTGCSPHNINFVLSDDASIQKLNEMVNERSIRVTTKGNYYSGENIIIDRDSTTVESFTRSPMIIPYYTMKEIRYTNGLGTEGSIELKDKQIFKAERIYLSSIDTVIKFDEVITNTVVFPTNELLKIQRRDHIHSTMKGLGYGLAGGAGIGAILGTFVGNTGGNEPPGLIASGSNFQGTPRPVIFIASTIFCGIGGAIVGSITGAIMGQWQDINITYNFVDKGVGK
jgi:hypothetical protein